MIEPRYICWPEIDWIDPWWTPWARAERSDLLGFDSYTALLSIVERSLWFIFGERNED
jgi:hypothetical protein